MTGKKKENNSNNNKLNAKKKKSLEAKIKGWITFTELRHSYLFPYGILLQFFNSSALEIQEYCFYMRKYAKKMTLLCLQSDCIFLSSIFSISHGFSSTINVNISQQAELSGEQLKSDT